MPKNIAIKAIAFKANEQKKYEIILNKLSGSKLIELTAPEQLLLLSMEEKVKDALKEGKGLGMKCKADIDYEIALNIWNKVQAVNYDFQITRYQQELIASSIKAILFSIDQTKQLLDIIKNIQKLNKTSTTYTTASQNYVETKISFQPTGKPSKEECQLAVNLLAPLFKSLEKELATEHAPAWQFANSATSGYLLASLTLSNVITAEELVELLKDSAIYIQLEPIKQSADYKFTLAFDKRMLNTELGRQAYKDCIERITNELSLNEKRSKLSGIAHAIERTFIAGSELSIATRKIKELIAQAQECLKKENYLAAIDYFSSCLNLLEFNKNHFPENLGEYNKFYANVSYNLGKIYQQQNDDQQAFVYYSKAKECYSALSSEFMINQIQTKIDELQIPTTQPELNHS